MQAIPLHRTTIFRPFTRFLVDIGAPVNNTLQQLKLPTLALDDRDYYISSFAYWAFVEKMALKEDIADLGFLAGNHSGANAIAPNFSKVLAHSASLYHGLLKTCQIVRADIARINMFVYCKQPGYIRYCVQPSFGITHSNHQRMEWFSVTVMLGTVHEFTGMHWRPKEIGLMSHQPPSKQIREYFPNCRFLFAQPYTYISIEAPMLSLPPLAIQNSKQNINGEINTSSDPFGKPADNFVDSLRQVLLAYLPDGTPPIALAAEIANTSVRSLQRELAKSKLTYLDILAQARLQQAKCMLKDTGLSVQEIAYKLGYSDASHFARAFRRSSGMSPSEYKKSID